MCWEKSAPSNLFWIAGILVDRSSDKQVWLHLEQTMVLISLSKHIKKFQVIIVFGHSICITSQSLFVPTNMVLKRYLACQTFNKMSDIQQWELFVHTYIHL